jgi:hypothetical protein
MPRRLAAAAFAAAILAGLLAASAASKNYILSIDGKDVEIDLGEALEFTAPTGQTMRLMLKRAETVRFTGEFVSFSHRGDLAVTSSDVDKDIRQHLLATANGSIVIVQEYRSIDPSTLTELMLQEMTKDYVAAGAKLEKSPAKRTIGERALNGLKGEVKQSSDALTIEVFTAGANGHGVVMVTQINADAAGDQAMIDAFWASVGLKL